MKNKHLLLTILLFIIGMGIFSNVINTNMIIHDSSLKINLENYILGVKIYGNITNYGDKPLELNKTDLFVFDYPLNTSDQHVINASAYVNGVKEPFRIIKTEDSATLIINTKLYNSVLKPGETISAGVFYNVSINLKNRVLSIIDFSSAKSIDEILDKAGLWNNISPDLIAKYTNITRLWNYTNPLVHLLIKYFNKTIDKSKPLTVLLNIIDWFDKNIVYSTRIPPRHPWEVIVEGAGDCDDQSNLLITILRSFRIPSLLEIGFVYISKNYYFKDTEANGYYTYVFIGGGGHAWVSAYIPPWGWLRIDLTVSLGKGLDHIRNAAFYILPTVIIQRVTSGDYATATAQYVESLEEEKVKIYVVLEMINYQVSRSKS
jgi:hypothetical protein